MRIIKEEDGKGLRSSFYLIGEGEQVVGVWVAHDNTISYYHYNDNFCLDETRKGRSQSSELDFLLCIGYEANKVFQRGLQAIIGIIYKIDQRLK